MAEASGVTPAERADLLEVERRWLALARALLASAEIDRKAEPVR
jgi:hypothetical protein